MLVVGVLGADFGADGDVLLSEDLEAVVVVGDAVHFMLILLEGYFVGGGSCL